jgi:hypothetical protein
MLDARPGSESKGGGNRVEFGLTLALSAIFVGFFVVTEDPYALGSAFLAFIAYGAAILISVDYALSRRREIPLFVVTALAIVGLAWVIGGGGYPASSATVTFTTTCSTFTNSTSGLVQNVCGVQPIPGQNIPLAIAENFIAWAPLVGCLLYAKPESSKFLTSNSLGKMVRGAVPAAALMFTLLGIHSSDGFNSPMVGIGPLSPYTAFRECDSATAINGCVYTNTTYLLVDYLFWIAVALLLAIVAGVVLRFAQKRQGQWRTERDDLQEKWAVVVLAFLVALGLTLVPPALTQGGAIVTSGSTFSFYSGDFLNIPMNSAHSSQLTGSFVSDIQVDVYLLNSTQFMSFDQSGNWYCPITGVTPLLLNATQGTFHGETAVGSYDLVFCGVYQPSYVPMITLQIISPIRLQQ